MARNPLIQRCASKRVFTVVDQAKTGSTIQYIERKAFDTLPGLKVFLGKVAGCIHMRGHMHREILEQGLVGKVPILNACVPLSEFSQASGGVPVQRAGM